MVSTARTALRAGLVIGGLALLATGAVEGSTFDVVVGALSAVVGGVGLWFAFRADGSETAESAPPADE